VPLVPTNIDSDVYYLKLDQTRLELAVVSELCLSC
jgi:hypothetical protein